MLRQLLLTLLGLTLGATATVHGHSVWIEPNTSNQLVICFAEPGTALETSPGQLDNLSAPQAFVLVTNKPVTIEAPKKAEGFLLLGATPTSVACAETSFAVRGGRKPNFYARWQPAGGGAGVPWLTLDLVPTGKAGEARACFRGKPLGGIKAVLRAPDETETELTADADGLIHFTAAQSGQYLLMIAHHREPLAGFHRGVAYTETSHNCSLAWEQKQAPSINNQAPR